jgi:xanthine dehydrogenase molybdenum-binding subunit
MLGRPVPDPTHAPKATGTFPFLGEVELSGALHAAVIRSSLPRAAVVAIDRGELLRRPGVVAVFAASDVPRRLFNPATLPPSGEMRSSADKALLTDRPRHVGDGIAVVVATTRAAAMRAARTPCAQLRPLPPVLSLEDASRQDKVLCRIRIGVPAAERLLALSDLVLERSMRLSAAQHLCLETHACAAEPGTGPGEVRVWSNTQSPHDIHRLICDVLELEPDRVRVTKMSEGGGFGAKQEMYEEALAAWLALRLGRPVRFAYTREEEFTAGRVRQETELTLRAGFDRTGRLVATSLAAVVDAGAYASHTPYVLSCIAGHLPSMYPGGAHDFTGVAYYTNRTPSGAYRGYGVTEAASIVESVMDEAAATLDIDPLQLRAANVGAGGAGDKARGVLKYLGTQCRAASAPLSRSAPPSRDGRPGPGVGHAVAVKSSVADPRLDKASAAIRVTADGRVVVATGTCDSGTGSSTGLMQIAAAELGIDDLSLLSIAEGQSDLVSADLGSTAQRSIFVGGQAVARAARSARRLLFDLAAAAHGAPPGELELRWPRIGMRGTPGSLVHLSELIRELPGAELVARAATSPAGPGISAVAVRLELALDRQSRRLAVPACQVVVDCGTVVNPRAARGQVTGAVVQGLGLALTDQAEPGTRSILQHGAPRSVDVPALKISFADGAGRAPTGVGELVIAAVPAAVASAFRAATGVVPDRLPLRPAVVERLLDDAGVSW